MHTQTSADKSPITGGRHLRTEQTTEFVYKFMSYIESWRYRYPATGHRASDRKLTNVVAVTPRELPMAGTRALVWPLNLLIFWGS